jgi:hypothetical protein
MMESRGGGVAEEVKLRLHGLLKQAKINPSGDSGKACGVRSSSSSSSSSFPSSSFSPSSSSYVSSSTNTKLSTTKPANNGTHKSTYSNTDNNTNNSTSSVFTINNPTPINNPTTNPVTYESQEDAMRAFLITLFSIAPYWKYEQFL